MGEAKSGLGGDYRSIEYIDPIRIAEHLAMDSNTAIAYRIKEYLVCVNWLW